MRLPKFLEEAIANNTTSLGTHPAFPPDENESFVSSIIHKRYDEVMEGFEGVPVNDIINQLNELVTKCQEMEKGSIEALEKLCSDLCATIFQIPDDTINMEGHIVNECDMSNYRMTPDSDTEFQFDDIDDMDNITNAVYQRRMVDVLMTGISIYYASNIEFYVKEIYKINPELVNIYQQIIKLNNVLLFNQRDTISSIDKANTGRVDVLVGNEDERISVKSEGVIFPVLLEYSIRGILEMASLHGLPKDREKASYVMGKADYRLAENWDMRLGVPLWSILASQIIELGYDVTEVGTNFIVMEISKLDNEDFNEYLKNAFKGTKKGYDMTKELVDVINYNKELDDFNNFVQVNNGKYAINDDSEYTAQELLSEMDNCQ